MIQRFIMILLVAGMSIMPASLSAQDSTSAQGLTIHVVQRGETLFRIALSYNLTIDELAELNGITNPDSIEIGQRLLVPVSIAEAIPQTHAVQAGETLRSIAELYGVSMDELAALNEITDVNTIYVGQVLTITPGETTTDTPTPTVEVSITSVETVQEQPATSTIHIVQSGETLFRIATQYGLTVNELSTANNIADPTLIYAGQQLIIPGIKPPYLAVDLPAPLTALEVNPQFFVEGETGRISITTSVGTAISAVLLGQTPTVISDATRTSHMMLIGIPIFTEAGIYPVNLSILNDANQTIPFTFNIQVLPGNYGSQTISLSGDKVSLLEPAVEDYELNLLTSTTSNFTAERYFNGPFGLPAAAPMNSSFGTIRSYNGSAYDRYHSGVDFAGAPGTPILAAAPGVVVLADTLNIRGNATVIDHGWGVFTTYSHQTAQYVQVGDVVTTGQVIGTVGATGRATGAHLHWEVWINGIAVNPLQWVQAYPMN